MRSNSVVKFSSSTVVQQPRVSRLWSFGFGLDIMCQPVGVWFRGRHVMVLTCTPSIRNYNVSVATVQKAGSILQVQVYVSDCMCAYK